MVDTYVDQRGTSSNPSSLLRHKTPRIAARRFAGKPVSRLLGLLRELAPNAHVHQVHFDLGQPAAKVFDLLLDGDRFDVKLVLRFVHDVIVLADKFDLLPPAANARRKPASRHPSVPSISGSIAPWRRMNTHGGSPVRQSP